MENRLFIEKDGERIFLDAEQSCSIRNQIRMQDAYSTLEGFGCTNIDEISDEKLLEIGYALEDAIYSNTGDVEFDVINDFSDIIKLESDEDVDDYDAYVRALEELNELNLDASDYDYYRTALDDLHYADIISAEHGEVKYADYSDIIADAKRTVDK